MDFMKYTVELIGFFFSVIIAAIFWSILIIPTKIFISFAIAIVFFFTYTYLIRKELRVSWTPLSLRNSKILYSCILALAVLSVTLINPIDQTIATISWTNISPPNLVRLITGSFLTLFSPGYLIISLIDRNRKLKKKERLLFSILISLLVLPFLSIFTLILGSNIQQLGISFVVLLNIILFLPYFFLKRDKSQEEKTHFLHLRKNLILISVVVFTSIVLLSKYSANLTWDYGDLDTYYGFSVSFTKDVFPLSPIGYGLNYPYWPFVVIANFFVISGIPYINAFQFITIPIVFLPILSLYVMSSAFFEKSRFVKIPIIVTLLGFFGGGFGWIFSTHLLTNSQTTQNIFELFDITTRTNSGYLIPSFYTAIGTSGIYPLYTFALTSIFALIWLIFSKRATKLGNLRYALISPAIALGYLAHIAEIVFFIFFFLISILIIKNNEISSYRKSSLSIFLGLTIIALVDFIVGSSYYTAGSAFAYFGFSLYYGCIGLVIVALFLSLIKSHLKTPKVNIKMHQNGTRYLKIFCSSLVIYLYGLSIIIWSKVFENYNFLPTNQHIVPWYGWANRLGICGLIALPGIIYLIHKNKGGFKNYYFFVLLVPVSFIIARILHIVPSFYFEDRLTFFIMIPVVILGSFVLVLFSQNLQKYIGSNAKHVILGFVLTAILILGFLPSLLVTEAVDLNYWSGGEKLKNSELDALNFLRLNTPVNSSVLTLTLRSNRLLSYAGLFPVQIYVNRDPSLIFSSLYLETTLYSVVNFQIKFVYLTSQDKGELALNPDYSGFVRDYLIKYLPIAFQNEEVTVYEFPEFASSRNSSTAIVMPNLNIGYSVDVFNETYAEYCRYASIISADDFLTVKTDDSANNHDFELPIDINPNEYPYIRIRWKTDGSNLYFYPNLSNTFYYISLGSSTSWETTTINTRHFYDFIRNETVDISSIGQISSILFRCFELNSEFSIDSIQFVGFSNEVSSGDFLPLSMVALSQNKYSTVLEVDPARFNYSTLILTRDLNLLDETENEYYQRYMDWINQGGQLIVLESSGTLPSYESMNLTLSDYVGLKEEDFGEWTTLRCSSAYDNNIITVETNNEDLPYYDFVSPPVDIPVENYSFVVIRWKTDGSPLYFYPHGSENGYYYIELGRSIDWTTSVIDLDHFYDSVLKNYTGFGKSEHVDNMLFRSFTGNSTYSIDYLEFNSIYPLPPQLGFGNLLSLYQGNTVVAEGIESQTENLIFPSMITVPMLCSNDLNVTIDASYTINKELVSPYAFTKKVGSGRVTYLVVSPYFSAIDASEDDVSRTLFRDIGSLLELADLTLNKAIFNWTSYFPQFDFIKNPTNFTGTVSVETDFIQFPILNLNHIITVSNIEETRIDVMNNTVIQEIDYIYPVNYKIDALEMQLAGSGIGKYLNLEIMDDFNLTVTIPKNKNFTIELWNGNTLLNKKFSNCTIILNFAIDHKTSILVKNPKITIDGIAYFNRARIYRNSYEMPLFYNDGSNPFEVVGTTTFDIKYSDNGVSFIDNFDFNGTWTYPSIGETLQPSFTELDIPWLNVLISPFHIVLITIISSMLLVYAFLCPRKTIRIKLKRGKFL